MLQFFFVHWKWKFVYQLESIFVHLMKKDENKKVFLRERKRHTDRGVSSTTEVGCPPLSGYPPPPARSDGGYPRWGTPLSGYPLARSEGGTWGGVPPIGVPPGQVRWGVPKVGYPHQVPLARSHRGVPKVGYPLIRGGTPCWGTPHQGTPLARSDGGVPEVGYPPVGYPPAPPRPGLWGTRGGVPPQSGYPPQVWTDRRADTSQNITFPSYYVRGR